MKDLHSHLLYGIDDGCKTIEESINLIKKASEQGITDLMITPHYMYNTKYVANNRTKLELLENIKKELKEKNININLYLGNEVYITDNIIELIKKGEIRTLNNTRYILIEFPLMNMLEGTKEILYELVRNGCIPVLAHPERYRIFKRHPELIEEYLREGVLLQCNYKSLYGRYGKDAKKTIKFFLKHHLVTFLGSDNHHEENYKLRTLKFKLRRLVKNKQEVEDLLSNNFDKLINDIDLGMTPCNFRSKRIK